VGKFVSVCVWCVCVGVFIGAGSRMRCPMACAIVYPRAYCSDLFVLPWLLASSVCFPSRLNVCCLARWSISVLTAWSWYVWVFPCFLLFLTLFNGRILFVQHTGPTLPPSLPSAGTRHAPLLGLKQELCSLHSLPMGNVLLPRGEGCL
jgi:hypothetical protein